MKLVICTKFQVNRMNWVESRRGGPIDPPPSRLRVTSFSRRLLELNIKTLMICINVSDFYVLFKTLLVHMTANVRSLTGHFGRYFELSLQHNVVETTFDICEIVIGFRKCQIIAV